MFIDGKITFHQEYDPYTHCEPTRKEDLIKYITDRNEALEKPVIDLDDKSLYVTYDLF